MSLFEWFCERKNLGAIGTLEVGQRGLPSRSNGMIAFRFVIAFTFIVSFYFLLYSSAWPITVETFIIPSILLVCYCLFGFFIRPKPDISNMGWVGGLINNPFRITDNLNRKLMVFKIFLMPGAFIAESLIQFLQLLLSSKNL